MVRRYELLGATIAAVAMLVWLTGGSLTGAIPGAADLLSPSVPLAAAPSSGGAPAAAPAGSSAAPPAVLAPSALPPLPLGSSTDAPPAAAGDISAPTTPATEVDGGGGGSGGFGSPESLATLPNGMRAAGVAAGPGGAVWATAAGPSGATLLHFGPDGALVDSVTLKGAGSAHGMTFGSDGRLYVLTANPAQVLAISTDTGAVDRYASIPDVSGCIPPVLATGCDGSVAGAAPLPTDLAFDAAGRLYVTDTAQGAIWRVAASGTAVTQLVVDSTWTNPVRPAGPTGIAVGPDNSLTVAVQGTLDSDLGRIVKIPIGPSGSPGTRTELAVTDSGALPGEVAIGESGRIYVALVGAGRVLVLERDGREFARVPQPSTDPLDAPVALAFRGESLLVACRGGASRVVRLSVNDNDGSPASVKS
jgi:sugar lactone lactonase YvrE